MNVDKVKEHLGKYKVNKLGCQEDGLYRGEKHAYILPKDQLSLSFKMKDCKSDKIIDVNQYTIKNYGLLIPGDNTFNKEYCLHLNSSQALCINFFQRVLGVYEDEGLLKKIIKEAVGKDVSNYKVKRYGFEHKEYKYHSEECYKNERTSFDFYVEMEKGKEILRFFWEIKYTENSDGKPNEYNNNKDHYEHIFIEKYKKIMESSLNKNELKKFIKDKELFYNKYQIYRCIAYVKDQNDYCIFVIPKINKIYKDVEETIQANALIHIGLISWDEIFNKIMDSHVNKNRKDEKDFLDGMKEKYFLDFGSERK